MNKQNIKRGLDPHVLKVGLGCNNNCKFCFQDRRGPLFRSKKAIINELIEKRKNGFLKVVFEGGEITLRKDIFEIIGYAKKLGFKKVEIQSNGRMFAYKEICRKFI